MTLEEAIKHCESTAERCLKDCGGTELYECGKDFRQLAEWLTELKEAKGIIRVCNRVLGYLLECEIENTSTRQEVETLLKGITEYMSGGNENG